MLLKLIIITPILCQGFKTVSLRHSLTLQSLNQRSTPVQRDSYEKSSPAAKFVVSALTKFFNFFGKKNDDLDIFYVKDKYSEAEVLEGIRGDFRRGYLFSGDIGK